MTSPRTVEADAWWGSCSIGSIVPGLLVSLSGSAVVVGLTWMLPHRSAAQLIIISLLGVFWLCLLLFWIYRIFGVNYRLTTRRLFIAIGMKYRKLHIVDVTKISEVRVKAGRVERFLGIGRIFVHVQDGASPMVLSGVPGPLGIADKIRSISAEARKHSVGQECGIHEEAG